MTSCISALVLLALVPTALCVYGPLEYAVGMSDNAKFYLMCEHNVARIKIATGNQNTAVNSQPKATNMQALCWCEELVAKAQQHASNCTGPPHDPRPGRSTSNFPDVGQNFMKGGDSTPIDQAINAFTNESNGYNFDANTCDPTFAGPLGECGHYTAVAWAATQCLGCAYDSCSSEGPFGRLVCNYGPGGNIAGQSPYLKGEPCTQCGPGQICLNNALCSDPLNCANSGLCPVASNSLVDLLPAGTCAAYRDSPSIRICAPESPYHLFAQMNCRQTCNFVGGNRPVKVCAPLTFAPGSSFCDQLTTVDHKECIDGNGLNYAGTKNTTKTGDTCLAWSTDDPGTNYYIDYEFPERSKAAAKNYCRNPASSGSGPWCYTTNPNVRWEYCDVPQC